MSLILSGTDGLSDVDGTAATPAIRGTDANTGIFFPAADTIAFTEGGVEAMRIDSNGNVGIGVTPNASVKLQVKTTTNQDLAVVSSSFVAGGVGLAAVNDAFSAYTALDLQGSSIQIGTGGTERMRIDSSGNLLVNTTTAQTGAKLSVTGGISGTITSATAVASTSGTSIDFTSIPSWVKRITVMMQGVSASGTSNWLVQIGAGSIQSTSYVSGSQLGGSSIITSTAGMILLTGTAASTYSGIVTIASFGSNTWVSSHSAARSDGAAFMGGGHVTLSGTLDRLRFTTVNGTDTFDAGSINILYEG